MIVIKLGGSLTQSGAVVACLEGIEKNYQGTPVVIVPGGGGFADQVRLSQAIWQFDDITAHAMAILAMQQMALLFHGLKKHFLLANSVEAIREQWAVANVVIWSPDVAELDRAGVPASWDITSDSLACWLATMLAADRLVVVKSTPIDPHMTWQALAQLQVVDKAFGEFAAKATHPIQIVGYKQFIG